MRFQAKNHTFFLRLISSKMFGFLLWSCVQILIENWVTWWDQKGLLGNNNKKCPSLFLRFDRKMTHFAWHTNHPRIRRRRNRNTKLERLRRTDELLPTMAAAKMLIYFYINATSTKNRARFEKNKSHSEILSNFSWVNFQWNYMWPQMCFCIYSKCCLCFWL